MSKAASRKILIDEAVVTTTSDAFLVGDKFPLSVQFLASSVTSGNGVLTVDVSNDGTNWEAYNRLTSNATNTNAQADTRVSSATLSADGSEFLFFPEGDYFTYMRAKVTRTTDGTYSVIVGYADAQ